MKQPLDVTHPAIHWNAADQRFSCELSSISLNHIDLQCHRHKPIELVNPNTGAKVTITWVKDDKDGSGEDTYGFNYVGYSKETGRHFTFLFIND